MSLRLAPSPSFESGTVGSGAGVSMSVTDPRLQASAQYKRIAIIQTCERTGCACRSTRRRSAGSVHCPVCNDPTPSLQMAVRGNELTLGCLAGCQGETIQTMLE